jgi:hypothetical protein
VLFHWATHLPAHLLPCFTYHSVTARMTAINDHSSHPSPPIFASSYNGHIKDAHFTFTHGNLSACNFILPLFVSLFSFRLSLGISKDLALKISSSLN